MWDPPHNMPRYRRKYAKRKRSSKTWKKKRGTARVRSGRLAKSGLFTRTLQVATQRQKNIKLKFISNQQYLVCCQSTGTGTYSENTYLSIRCNGIASIMYRNGSQNIGGASAARSWAPVGTGYGPGVTHLDADGVALWLGKYNHFTVVSSKLTATFNTTNCQEHGVDTAQANRSGPVCCYIHKSSTPDSLLTTSTAGDLLAKPYVVKQVLQPGDTNTGCKLSMAYSAKHFEGVKGSVVGHDQLRGGMASSGATNPGELSYLHIGIMEARGTSRPLNAGIERLPIMMINLHMEYVVALTEPSDLQQPGMPFAPAVVAGGGGAAAPMRTGY